MSTLRQQRMSCWLASLLPVVEYFLATMAVLLVSDPFMPTCLCISFEKWLCTRTHVLHIQVASSLWRSSVAGSSRRTETAAFTASTTTTLFRPTPPLCTSLAPLHPFRLHTLRSIGVAKGKPIVRADLLLSCSFSLASSLVAVYLTRLSDVAVP